VVFALQPPLLVLIAALAVSWPVIGLVWVPALAELTSAAERVGADPARARPLQPLLGREPDGGFDRRPQLARTSEAAPFVVLACIYALAALGARSLAPA